ncbi:hypothetical protein E1180_18260 [Roseibium denhamense]|uniref:Uncharacterized protein n=1 Tax=Roseibium denhamense TaxID=76305 RepID=A0ABY1PCI5_9HYPH|nr:hypothetical protein [Roseibium denhamense]MTI07449.1 hypothetical protein [Roseibium denhamense]SMP29775.1 hypothetical protein SAMN06265374_3140 [Roseibium denhamense]
MNAIPRYVSFVAFALGSYDVVRGIAHTVFAGYAATEKAGVDLTGPAGLDLLILMLAFGASNLVTASALIYLALTDRRGSLLLLGLIPFAYFAAHIGLELHGVELVGQGVFPGRFYMMVYLTVCALTATSGALVALRRMRAASEAANSARPHLDHQS